MSVGCVVGVHVAATVWPELGVIVARMRMQLTALFAMAAYFVYTTTFAGIIAGLIDLN